MDRNYLIDRFCDVQDQKSYRKRVIACSDWLLDAVRYVFEKQGYAQPESIDLKELLWNPVFVSYVGDIDFIERLDSVRKSGDYAMYGLFSVSQQDDFGSFDIIQYFINYLLEKDSDPSLASIRDMPIPGLIKGKWGTVILEQGYFNRPAGIYRKMEKDPTESTLTLSQRIFNIRLEIVYQLQNANWQSDEWCKQYYEKLKGHLHSEVYKMKLFSDYSYNGSNKKYLDKIAEKESWDHVSPEMIHVIRQHIIPEIKGGEGVGGNGELFDLRMYNIEHALLSEGNLQRVPYNVWAARQMIQYLLDEEVCDPRVIGYAHELVEFVSDKFWEAPSVSDIESKRSELVRIVYLYNDLGQPITIDEQEDISMAGLLKEGI